MLLKTGSIYPKISNSESIFLTLALYLSTHFMFFVIPDAKAQNIIPMAEGYGTSHYEWEKPYYPIVSDPSIQADIVCKGREALALHELRDSIYRPENPPRYHISCTWQTFEGRIYNSMPTLSYYTTGWGRLCPYGYRPNSDYTNEKYYCEQKSDFLIPFNQNPGCTVGNPILIALGEKTQHTTDIDFTYSPISFGRFYNSGAFTSQVSGSFGNQWGHSYDRRIVSGTFNGQNRIGVKFWYYEIAPDGKYRPLPNPGYIASPTNNQEEVLPTYAYVFREDGKSLYHRLENNQWMTDYGTQTRLSYSPEEKEWLFITKDNTHEIYDSLGRLIIVKNPQSQTQSLSYETPEEQGGDGDSSTLDRVEDNSGNFIAFNYNEDKRIKSIVTSSNQTYDYEYNTQGYLSGVTYPNGNSRQYHYEIETKPHLLTGITDERGVRYASWSYDDKGRAISSEHEGGADRVILNYYNLSDRDGGSVTVTNTLGKQTIYHYEVLNGVRKLMRVEGEASENCEAANQAYTYDDNGYMTSKTDWQGNITAYVHNDRGQEISRTEASGTPEARTITTEWHPEFNLPIRILESEREITFTYDTSGRLLIRSYQEIN